MIQVLKNSESKPKTCENGIQGVHFAGRCAVSTAFLAGPQSPTVKGIHTKVKDLVTNATLWNISEDVSTSVLHMWKYLHEH